MCHLLVALMLCLNCNAAPLCRTLWQRALPAFLIVTPPALPPDAPLLTPVQLTENAADESLKAVNPEIDLELKAPFYLAYVPTSVDQKLGAQASDEIKKRMQVLPDAEVQQAISRIGQRLVDALDRKEFPYTFTVVDDPSVNAFAIPGGPLFVHSGLIQAVRNEAELAGVLAHEIGHAYLRHPTEQMIQKMGLTTLLQFVAGQFISEGSFGEILQSLAGNLISMRFSRKDENEADLFATRLMARAGYDPRSLAHFFQLLEGKPSPPAFLSSHPNPGDRVKAVLEAAEGLNVPAERLSTGEPLTELKARL